MLPKKIYSKSNIDQNVNVTKDDKKDEVNEIFDENYDKAVDDMDVSKPEDETTEERPPKLARSILTKQKKELPRKLPEATNSQSASVVSDMDGEEERENLDDDLENAADNGEQQDDSKEQIPSETPVNTPPNLAMQKRMPPHKPTPQRSISSAKYIQPDNQMKIQTVMQKVVQMSKQEVTQKFSGDRFQRVNTVSVSRRSSRTDAWLSVVNANNGNKRLSLGNKLMMMLNNPEQIQIRFSDYEIAISKFFSDEDSNFNVRSGSKGNQNIIYSAGLIDEITECFELDFTGISCISFFEEDASVDDDHDNPVVIIRMM